MLLPLLVILALLMWFFGIDFIAQYRRARRLNEKRILQQLTRRPPPAFIQKRKQLEPLLLQHSEYYRLLSDVHKLKFLYRCSVFMHHKRFEGREGLIISDEIKIRITAAAIQLTFGLEDFRLYHFHTILLYPGVYTSPVTGVLHRGETNMRGLIILSWQHFTEGYASNSDRINLGLHELAHALDLSRIVKKADPFFHTYFNKWLAVSDTVFHEVNREENHFLRKYSGTDQREFFAVCVEQFFEDPQGFNNHLPHLYRHLCMLLKQDPGVLGKPEFDKPVWKQEETLLPGQTPDLLYSRSTSLFKASYIFYLPLALLVFNAAVPPEQEFSLPLVFFVFIFSFFRFNIRLRTLQLNATHLFIGFPVLKNKTKSFALDQIIFIRYFSGMAGGNLQITFMKEGVIESSIYRMALSRDEYNRFKEAMFNKDVLMSF